MSLYLRWGGVILLLIAALTVNRGYRDYLNRRLAEYRGLLGLIQHAEGMISKFLSYGKNLWRDFSDSALEKCGLLPALREGKSLSLAFDECLDNMALSREAKENISKKIQGLGSGYKDGELSNLRELREEISSELTLESEEAEKNIKVVSALLLGGALAVVIMVM